jgi:hypothetical protein
MTDPQSTPLAGVEAFQRVAAGQRRFKVVELPVIGPARMRSITASEYVAIEAAITRAGLAARQGKPKQHKSLLGDAYVDLLIIVYVDADGNPLFTDNDDTRQMLKKLDSAVSQAMVDAALKHCGLDEDDLEDLAKKSARASG